ncbi:MAG: glycine/betaine ABC transporter substrate-binding protein [Candidatus Desulforudis sp.]|nr:glycine/betaine ABC transporter substrate-binding protein [Desulforudis sp.]
MRKYHWLAIALVVALTLALVGCGGGAADEEWVFATDHEFSVRPDGLPDLQNVYGFQFDDVITMDLGVTYGALKEGQVPAAMGFATDGRIKAFGLVNLVDDKQFFPVYNPAPVVRAEVLGEYPEIEEILGAIGPRLDTDTMIELNGLVDIEGQDHKQVAKDWLLSQNLIDPEAPEGTKGPIKVGSKEFTEQLILGAMSVFALENAGFTVVDQTGLQGTEVARSALEEGEIDTYWEYTGTAWLVALGHEEPITDSEEAFQKVSAEDLEKNELVWLDYAQFDNTYTIMMRQADAEAKGITSISDLARVINER